MKRRNMFTLLKAARITVALVMLAMMSMLFLRANFPDLPSIPRWPTLVQFAPSVLRFLSASALIVFVTGFGAVLVITLLWGRIYCSTVCPLGILQDIISFLQRKLFYRKKKFRFLCSHRVLRYSIAVFAVCSMASGFMSVLLLIEPYAFFGRSCNNLISPLLALSNNAIIRILGTENVTWLYPIETTVWEPYAFMVALVSFLLLTVLVLRYGRVYCNTFCPVGAVLSILSRFALFKLTINHEGCTNCGMCEKNCKSGCIDVNSQKIDFERCVMCFNCGAVCQSNAICFKSTLPRKPTEKPNKHTDMDRRKFLITAGILGAGAATAPALLAKTRSKTLPVMPPGAVILEHFNSKCVGCHLCISSCPTKVIEPATLQYGLAGFMQPKLNFQKSMCEYDCTICSNVCPAGALRPLSKAEKHQLQIGRVEYRKNLCVVYTDRKHCGACAEHCPTQAVRMVPWENGLTIPQTDVSTCVGCGSCEHICPVLPVKAIAVNGVTIQDKAQPPKSHESATPNSTNDFPF